MLNMAKLHFSLMFLLLCFMPSLAWGTTNITTDKSALLAFKSSITFDPDNLLANWSVSSSRCTWVGVTCNTHHGRVHSLNLGDMGLKGSISPQLGNLSFLVELDLSNNNFNGQMPKELLQLRRLKLLNLSYNEFDGEIHTWIGDLSALQHLNLCNNSFSGFIPLSVSNLSKLETLNWGFNFVEGTIPLEIGRLQHLKIFRIAKNKFSGIIPQIFFNLSSLELLSLASNTLLGIIPKEIGYLPQLKIMYLGNNKLSGYIPYSIFNTSTLQRIGLEYNHLFGSLPSNMCYGLPKLELLSLHHNYLSGVLPSDWHQCKELKDLELSNNNFNRGYLPSDIGNLTNLQYLYLTEDNLEGEIPPSLFNMSSLRLVNLVSNHLHGNLPQDMCNQLPLLETLGIAENHFEGSIPKSISNCTSLKLLALEVNSFTEIPDGGPFKNFTARVMNEGLCGNPKLQVQPCRKGNKHGSTKEMLLLKCLLPIIVATILVVSYIFFLKPKRDYVGDSTNRDVLDLETPIRIPYYELLQITNGFNESNLLGRGSFGSVYKGVFLSGKTIAVKVFNLDLEEALRSFDIECNAMCNLRHRNLIKIISSCSNVDFKSLIMEFMPNGSLDRWLYSHNYCLDILQRLNIMIDVASALEYLHHGSSIPVVHCDVKPSNVLLDEDMVAHLSDFGIAKLLNEGQLEIYTKTFATMGYIAPEYGSRGVVSIKGDVYSYGIMLIEVFTRKKPTDNMFVQDLSLKDWVSKSLPHAITHVLDHNLLQRDNQSIHYISLYISSIFELALSCCTDLPDTRINMTSVVVSLKRIKAMFLQSGI